MNYTSYRESVAALVPLAFGIALGVFGIFTHAWLIVATLTSKVLRSKTNFFLLFLSVIDVFVCCGYVQVKV